ncbi:carboxypeptidase regulatory-like domain-containing protein [Pelistega sp. NLN82]|uniref:Carboxypeptidase regulatory-like domain-containing protein n=1 Tax=Pelistega ratti TaxID=2652177 RepID=A0A6L9Y3H8_9BURK|nr:carboxypeptidase regulatory-like domain-containing protein [Pelistega ratti]NEN74952.1 carboxypeptidase regulatory-like domain-containing protein [Pelistega ratti]
MFFSHRFRFVSIVGITLFLAACSTVTQHRYRSIDHVKRPHVERVNFDPSDIKKGTGTTQLVGRAYLQDSRQFKEYSGAMIDVVLNPVSKASEQWFKEVCQRGRVLSEPASALYKQALYQVKTNTFGQFAFPNVPQGEYFLSTRLYWVDTAPRSGPVEYGGLLAKRVKLTSAAQAIDLNQQDRCAGYFH